jgi:hypothetical protein
MAASVHADKSVAAGATDSTAAEVSPRREPAVVLFHRCA